MPGGIFGVVPAKAGTDIPERQKINRKRCDVVDTRFSRA
jgi:hypothetical protein